MIYLIKGDKIVQVVANEEVDSSISKANIMKAEDVLSEIEYLKSKDGVTTTVESGSYKISSTGEAKTYDLSTYTSTMSETLFMNDVINCPYSGSEKSVVLNSGKYKLEAWGAQGSGDNGGLGGYCYGTLYVEDTITLYINVGNTTGGGSAGSSGGYAGGGASYISKVSGRLDSLYSYDTLIIAGGGGGQGSSSSGEVGGGLKGGGTYGGKSSIYTSVYTKSNNTGYFGLGGNSYGSYGSGGGAGYYGGYGTAGSSSSYNGGYGGSSYYNDKILTDCGTTSGQRSGNGYVKITSIEVV